MIIYARKFGWLINLVRRDVGLLSFAGDNGWLNFAREVKGWVVDIKLGLSYYAFRTLVPTQNGIRCRAESLYLKAIIQILLFPLPQDIVRKKMSELLILDLHNLAYDAIKTMASSRSFQIISERQVRRGKGVTLSGPWPAAAASRSSQSDR